MPLNISLTLFLAHLWLFSQQSFLGISFAQWKKPFSMPLRLPNNVFVRFTCDFFCFDSTATIFFFFFLSSSLFFFLTSLLFHLGISIVPLMINLMDSLITCRLCHPNIVQLLETYEDKTKVYLIMELWVLDFSEFFGHDTRFNLLNLTLTV